jgi:hypothetical protein
VTISEFLLRVYLGALGTCAALLLCSFSLMKLAHRICDTLAVRRRRADRRVWRAARKVVFTVAGKPCFTVHGEDCR